MTDHRPPIRAAITAAEAVSAYGDGVEAMLEGLNQGRSAVTCHPGFPGFPVAAAPLPPGEEARCEALLDRLAARTAPLPGEVPLYLAVTIGAIDRLERRCRAGKEAPGEPYLKTLVEGVKRRFGSRRVTVISGACAASACAVARAAADLDAGRADRIAVLTVDALSEFIFSGFASLGALDPAPARPFDRDRAGLNLGEAAALTMLESPRRMSAATAPLAGIAGWGMSADATHATTPDQSGNGLARAIRSALRRAQIAAGEIGFIAAHGTGTRYNDAMEMAAFRQVFDAPRPVFSVKWGTGHTIAAAGLLQLIAACRARRDGVLPPNAATVTPDPEAAGWVSPERVNFGGGAFLSVNSGFGGINAALVLV